MHIFLYELIFKLTIFQSDDYYDGSVMYIPVYYSFSWFVVSCYLPDILENLQFLISKYPVYFFNVRDILFLFQALQKRGPGLQLENGYWPPYSTTKREPDYVYNNNANSQFPWSTVSKEYNYAPGLDSGCQIWNEAAQNCTLRVHQNKTAQKIKELSSKYLYDPVRPQRDVKALDVPDGPTTG